MEEETRARETRLLRLRRDQALRDTHQPPGSGTLSAGAQRAEARSRVFQGVRSPSAVETFLPWSPEDEQVCFCQEPGLARAAREDRMREEIRALTGTHQQRCLCE